MRTKPGELTVKQRKFVREYIKTGNATAAAKLVYHSSVPANLGYRVKHIPKVKNAIEEAFKKAYMDEDYAVENLKELIEAGVKNKADSRPEVAMRGLENFFKIKGYLGGGGGLSTEEKDEVARMDTNQILAELKKLDLKQASLMNILKKSEEGEVVEDTQSVDKPVQPEHQ